MSMSHKQEECSSGFQEKNSDEIDFKEIFSCIINNKWIVISVMLVVFFFSGFYLLCKSPIFRSTALIQVENTQSGIDASLRTMNDMGALFGQSKSALPSQIETALINSRYILEPTIRQLGLNIAVSNKYFPLVGSMLAQHYVNKNMAEHGRVETVAKPLFGMSSYAWGGEEIHIKSFDVENILSSKAFRLVAEKGNRYRLYSPKGSLLLEGIVGRESRTKKDVAPFTRIFVSRLKANSGAVFKISVQPIENVLTGLVRTLKIVDLGSASNLSGKVETGILSLSITGSNAAQLPRILNTILRYEVEKNIQKKSAEAQKTLEFLNKQLPILRKSLDQAETDLNNFRSKTGSLGISLEGKVLLEQLVKVEQAYEEAKIKNITLMQEFTSKHPFVIAARTKQAKLEQELNLLKNKLRELPKTEQKAVSLERDTKVQNQLYLLLLSKIQQLQVVKAGTISDVRILRKATSPIQLPSRRLLIMVLSLFVGFVLGLVIVFVKIFFTRTADDPDYVEEHLGIPAYALIPRSRKQVQLSREMDRNIPGSGPFVLAAAKPRDMAIEGLRSLRTTLQFSLLEARNNIVSILGASPNVGKSFISLNLAHVLADAGKKVLLIDSDLRKGKIASYLSLKNINGLAEILTGKITVNNAKKVIRENMLDFIPAGKYPLNPSELLLGSKLEKLLAEESKQYDIVLIDTPPILAVTDGIIVAKYAGVNLLLIGSKIDNLRELEHAVKRAHKNNIKIDGLIFNNIQQVKHGYGKYNYYYEYKANK